MKHYIIILINSVIFLSIFLLKSETIIASDKPDLSVDFNLKCMTESSLTLKKINFYSDRTTIEMEYFNAKISHDDDNFIFINTADTSQTFFIENISSSKRYYVYKTNIGISIKDHTKIKLGEVKSIIMELPAIEDKLSCFNIAEGMEGGNWGFKNLLINNNSKSFNNTPIEFQKTINAINDDNLTSAYKLISNHIEKFNTDAEAFNLLGIILFKQNKIEQAIEVFNKAVNIDMNNYVYFSNLYYLSVRYQNLELSLKYLNDAIEHNDNPDLIWERAFLLFKMKKYRLSINDFNQLLSTDRFSDQKAFILYNRAIIKIILENTDACDDLEKAADLNKNEALNNKIEYLLNKFCKANKKS